MIRDGLVIRIPCLADALPGACLGNGANELPILRQRADPLQIMINLLRYCCREHTRVRSGVRSQLPLIERLRSIQCLVRTELEKARAVILQLRQIVEEGRVLFLLLVRNALYKWRR